MAFFEKIITYGNISGTAFPEYNNIRSLAFAGGTFVDRIIVNGDAHGGPGGTLSETMILDEDEYINNITLRSGGVIDTIHVSTNKNKTLQSGGIGLGGGVLHCALVGGRLRGISGMVGYFPGFALPLISRLTFRVDMPDPPYIKDDCTKW